MENAISVSQVNNYIKSIFDAELMLQNIFVYGEIGTYKVTNGIAYFNLKDEMGVLPCVLFGADSFPAFEVGDQVVVGGRVSYYVKGGKLSFNAFSIERFGIGLLYQQFLELKSKLEAKGYFDEAIKRPLPARVRRIGVVSSETGAVIQDIIDVTTRRNDTVDIVLYPVKVQGLGADKEIAKAIDFFSTYDKVDVIIVARGGGSIEDLQPFNTEIVADAAFRCRKPLVSAVGHETDYTIIDFVSDLRAPTPSAAAELVVNKKSDEYELLQGILDDATNKINQKIIDRFQDIKLCNMRNDKQIANLILQTKNQLFKSLFMVERLCLSKLNATMVAINDYKSKFAHYDIASLTDKGFVKVFANGRLIKSVADVLVGQPIEVSLMNGKISAIVDGVNRGEDL